VCPSGKTHHLTRKDAKLAYSRALAQGWKPGYRLHVYRCPVCGLWHIGTLITGTRSGDVRIAKRKWGLESA
jgi:hypothetical protein